MSKYIDGFVLVVPKDKIEEYTKMAIEGRDSWMKHGALQYFECKGHDLVTDEMGGIKSLGFTKLTKATVDETVWFSFIVFKSREHRDEVNAKVMTEMGEKYNEATDFVMPFDMERMSRGGFSVEVEG